ncbi:MAG: DUF4279 domain-containing protein [Henriciella sp.]|nr:DUF4279 domain-containing protein [Henriciella sp.]
MPALKETVASLRILGDDLDPDEVTALLGKSPDVGARRGEALKLPSGSERAARTGRWSVKVARKTPGDLEAQIATLLSGTTNDLDVWRELTAKYSVDLFCGLFMDEGNEGLAISPGTLKLLGERGIALALDIYGPSCGSVDTKYDAAEVRA